ncbi:MAG: homoserine kinase [Pseudomonadota bacterium]
MAVYTDVSDEDLDRFLADYDLGEVLAFKGIAEGVENSNYLLRTDKSSYILTLYEKRVDPNDLPFFLGLMNHLAKGGFACPQPVENRDGAILGTLSDRPAAIVTFLEGRWPKRPNVDHCLALGKAMARMHMAGEGFEITRKNSLTVDGWPDLIEATADDANDVHPGLKSLIATSYDELNGAWPRDLPKGTIHADLFPDNVFFLRENLSGFIDFYFACNDLLAYDIAISLNAWCFETDGMFNVTKAKALVSGYQSVRSLSVEEYEALPILARGAALRFLLTRLYDWIRVPEGALVTPHDPLEYVRKLKFHRSVATTSAYGL